MKLINNIPVSLSAAFFLGLALLCLLFAPASALAGRTSVVHPEANRAREIFENQRGDQKKLSATYLQKLFAGPIPIGIELLLAGQGDQLGSGNGHAMLRFVSATGQPLNDIVISFVADVTDPSLDIIKAVNGSYTAIISAETLNSTLARYVYGEQRDLTRFPIPTSLEQREKLLSILKEIANRPPRDATTYAFAWRNCMTLLLKTLNEATILKLNSFDVRPSEIPRVVEQSLLSPYPGIRMVSRKRLEKIAGLIPSDVASWANRADVVKRIPVRELLQMIILHFKDFESGAIAQLMAEVPKGAEIDAARKDPFRVEPLAVDYYQQENSFATSPATYWSPELLKNHCRIIGLTLRADSLYGQPLTTHREAWKIFEPLASQLCANTGK